MASARHVRVKRASALLPLAVLSVAWTASLATAGSNASAASDTQALPDGTHVPSQPLQQPASIIPPGAFRGVHGNAHQIVASASASGIPAVALAAYQRAATVIDAADHSCHMPWQLVAAIGRVESDHGRADGNVLTDQGIARPGIFGPVLNGRNGTALIRDTDGGRYDGNTTYDRAVGPMQFIPSTWAIVGVDADNDGRRNPQDIYDASLGSAVYLCAGTDDLSTTAGQQAAVFRYNHSQRYVSLVLSIMHAYQHGDFTSVPNGTTSTGFSFSSPPPPAPGGHGHGHHGRHGHGHHGHHTPTTGPTAGPTSGPTSGPSSGPSSGPTGGPTAGPSTGLPTALPTLPTTLPTTLTTSLPTSTPTLLTHTQAVTECLAEGLVDDPLNPNDAFDQCVYALTH